MATAQAELSLFDRVLPQNIEAEQAVLGSMLLDNNVIHDVVQLITSPEAFFRDAHRKVYSAIVDKYNEAQNIDPLILFEELKRRGQLEEPGHGELTIEYLGDILDQTPTAANAVYYARIVREKAVARRLIFASTDILRQAYDQFEAADDLLSMAESRIFEIAQTRAVSETHHVADVLTDTFERLHKRSEHGGHLLSGLPTGFVELDDLTGGLQDSELVIVAARPSVGKTAFALNIAMHVAVEERKGVFIASLEQSKLELAERLLCSMGRVDGHKLRSGRVSSHDISVLMDAANDLRPAPMFIDDTPGRTLTQIAAGARRLKMKHDISLVVIDYLQLIESENKRESRQDQISQISRRLKALARELKVPVIALSQLNRSPEMREGHRPRMADLRESGAIEQDADVVMLLHRPDLYDKQAKPGTAEVIIAKQRNGPTGDVQLTFLKQFTRFENYSDQPLPDGDVPI
jgi:replicative DNA helicase